MLYKRLLAAFVLFLSTASASFAQGWGYDTYGYGMNHSLLHSRWNFMGEYNKAHDAGRDLNYFLRTELAVGYTFGSAIYHHHNHYEDADTRSFYDTTIAAFLKPKLALQIGATTGYPIMTTSATSAIILTYGCNMHLTTIDAGTIHFFNTTSNYKYMNMDLGFPLSFDYKSGGEAILDKEKRTCFTMGIGIEPVWISSELNLEYAYDKIKIMPFGKLEFGYITNFAAFKLRATIMPGNYAYFQNDEMNDMGHPSEIKVSNDNQFTLSLVIMSMVRKWGE